MVAEVPFVEHEEYGAVSRSVFLSALLSALIRPILPAVPLHALSAPTPGSGKSILVHGICILVTGHPCPMLSQSANEEEAAKVLSSALMAGYPVICFDNCEEPLGGAILCQAVSEPYLSVRILGKSELKKITNSAMYFATGNNLTLTGDIIRRAMRCTIDAKQERPEERKFTTARPDLAMNANRPDLVAAGLTVLRAFLVAGAPVSGFEPVGTFEAWSRMVRDCLIWLGEPDPWLSTEQIRNEDPAIENNIAALRALFETFATGKFTTKEVVDAAFEREVDGENFHTSGKYVNPVLNDALRVVTNNAVNSQNLGNWLRVLKDRPYCGFVVTQAGKIDGHNRWQVLQGL